MLDIKMIRDDRATVERAMESRGIGGILAPVMAADEEYRRQLREVEDLRAHHNQASKKLGQMKVIGILRQAQNDRPEQARAGRIFNSPRQLLRRRVPVVGVWICHCEPVKQSIRGHVKEWIPVSTGMTDSSALGLGEFSILHGFY